MEYAELRAIEHNLNESVEEPLALVSLKLRMVRQLIDEDPPAATAILDELDAELWLTLGQLRQVARRIYPALTEHASLVNNPSTPTG